MSENVEQVEQVEAEETEQEETEVDYETKYREAIKHSRDWEKRAKENKEAAEELERIKAERMTETEKLQSRAEKAEAELSRITAENERIAAAQEVSKATDVPQELLLFCKDKEAMEQFAQIYGEATHVPSAPKKQTSRIVRDGETPTSTRDVFAEMMENVR